jgi:dihydrofolate synthase/folylpolyglutamate synthase
LRSLNARRPAHTIAIVGMRARKESDGFVGALAGAVDHIIAVPLNEAHIAPALFAAQADLVSIKAVAAASLEAAMQEAAQFPAPRVVICGSFLLAGEALARERR